LTIDGRIAPEEAMHSIVPLAALLIGLSVSATLAQSPSPPASSPSATPLSAQPAPAGRRQPRGDDPAVQSAQESVAATDGVVGLNDWDRRREQEVNRSIRSICKGC
jgi:hypothetical protein